MKNLNEVSCKTKEARILFSLTFGKNVSGTFVSSYVIIFSSTVIELWSSFFD